VVFKLVPPAPGRPRSTQSILANFTGPNGAFPEGGLIADRSGNLYGTGGSGGRYGYGVVFKLRPPGTGQTRWTQTVLHHFNVSTSGMRPVGEPVGGSAAGHFFGVAHSGGPHLGGTIFEITP
jgi:hypothetical protein